jgi:hypothetical protein
MRDAGAKVIDDRQLNYGRDLLFSKMFVADVLLSASIVDRLLRKAGTEP